MSWHHWQIFLLLWFFIWSCLTIFTIQVKHMEPNTREQNKKHILLHEIRSIFSPWRAHSLVYRTYTSENWGRCIRMHWWRSIAACRAQTCWVYLSLVVFSHWQSTAQHWRGTQTFWQRCITCTSSQGRAGCPEQCLWWWRESFLKCTDWRSLGRQGLAGSPPLGRAAQCLWLLGVPSSLVHLGHGLARLLRQPLRVRQDRGAPAQLPQGVQHHWGKKKAGKHQEKLLIWLISLLQNRAALDSYKCKLNTCERQEGMNQAVMPKQKVTPKLNTNLRGFPSLWDKSHCQTYSNYSQAFEI